MKTESLEKVITDLRNFKLVYNGDDDNDYEAQHDEIAPLCEESANDAADALESKNFMEFASQIERIKSLESDTGCYPDWYALVTGWDDEADQWSADEFESFASSLK
jgi:hypothetical protein